MAFVATGWVDVGGLPEVDRRSLAWLAHPNCRAQRHTKAADQAIWFWTRTLCNLVKASARSDVRAKHAPLAQSAERFHGKEKVNGSIPLGGSLD